MRVSMSAQNHDESAGHGGAAKLRREVLTPIVWLDSRTWRFQRTVEALEADFELEVDVVGAKLQ